MTRAEHIALMERNVAQRRLRAVMYQLNLHEKVRRNNGGPDEADEHLYEKCREVARKLPPVEAVV